MFLFCVNILTVVIYAEQFKVTTHFEPKKIFLGDKVYFKFIIISNAKMLNVKDNLTERLRKYEIKDLKKDVKNNKAIFSFQLQFFRTGEIVLPQIEFTVQTKNDKLNINSDSLKIKVMSNLNDNSTFQPVKPPVTVKFYLTSAEWVMLLILFLILLLIAVFVYFFIKRKKEKKESKKFISPFEEAKQGLKTCRQLIENNAIRMYYFLISEIFRKYIDRKFHFSTLEATLKEIEYILTDNSMIAASVKMEIMALFKKWELYKFTNNFPDKLEALKDLEDAERIIEDLEKSFERQEAKNNDENNIGLVATRQGTRNKG